MADDLTFKAEGFEELFKKMDTLAQEIGKGKTDKIWRTAMKYAFEPVLQDAKTFAPAKTHQLEEHIYMKVHRPMARDKSGKAYAEGEIYMARVTASTLRDDTVYNSVLNKNNKFQTVATNKKPVPVSQEFGNARTPAHPFLRPALEVNYQRVESRLGWAIWQQLEKFGKKE